MELKNQIRWGLFGTGKISYSFAEQLLKAKDSKLAGVASRRPEHAKTFARTFSGIKAYDSYEALCHDPRIDAVYIATPTHAHFHHGNMVLDANKALLCEKPFTTSQDEARKLIEKAREKKLFCMEAMWMRFNPFIQKAKQILSNNEIGTPCTLHVEIGYKKESKHLHNASLTFGCYGLSLAIYLFGKPEHVSSHVIKEDETGAILLHYPDNIASIFYSEGLTLSNEASVFAKDGCLRIESPFINATALHITRLKKMHSLPGITRLRTSCATLKQRFYDKKKHHNAGFKNEAEEVVRCMQAGLIESPTMPLSETLLVHQILDKVLSGIKR